MNPQCPYCGRESRLVESRVVYGREFGCRVYACVNFPVCDSYVGAHADGSPKGTLANAELRRARIAAHNAFDVLWKSGRKARHEAYRWLAKQLGLSRDETHIGMFSLEQCRQVVAVCGRGKARA